MILMPNSQIGLRAESGAHGPKQKLQWGISLLYNILAPCKATKEDIVRILVTWGQVLKAKLGNIIRSLNEVELCHQLGSSAARESSFFSNTKTFAASAKPWQKAFAKLRITLKLVNPFELAEPTITPSKERSP